jgi:hypothetical protein
MNYLINLRKIPKYQKSFIETCTSNIIDDPKEIANKFNGHFTNVGPSLENKIKQKVVI